MHTSTSPQRPWRGPSITHHLALASGAFLALTVILAGIAWLTLDSGRRAIEEVVDASFQKVDLIRELRQGENTQARLIRNAVIGGMLKDPREVADNLAAVDAATEADDRLMGRLEAMIKTPADDALFKTVVEKRADYAKARMESIRLLREGHAEAAGVEVLGDLRDKQTAFFDSLAKMGEVQKGLLTRSGDAAKAEINKGVAVTLSVAAGLIMLTILYACFIARSIK